MAAASRTEFRHGFRVDPMTFVDKDTSVDAALVRTVIFKKPKPADKQVLGKKIDAVFAKQREDGALSNHYRHAVGLTGEKLMELIDLGVDPNHPKVRKAVACVVKHNGMDKGDKQMSCYNAQALCLLGKPDAPGVKAFVTHHIDTASKWIHPRCGCPWTPAVQLRALWVTRKLDPRAHATIARGLKGIATRLNAAGCHDFNDPWGYLDAAGTVDHPLGRQIVEKQAAMILRSQRKDGGWGKHSVKVFRALTRYGLLEKLRQLPPLPPDFKIVRSIPAPDGDLFTMTFGDAKLWVYDRNANEAVAVSPEDGKVQKRLKLPVENVRGIGWSDGQLAVATQTPEPAPGKGHLVKRRLYRVEPATGKADAGVRLRLDNIFGVSQVGGKLVVADGFFNAVAIFDAAEPGRPRVRTLATPGSINLAPAGAGAIWHTDWLLTSLIVKSGLNGKLLDWGTAPFEGGDTGEWEKDMAVKGLAHDGKHLWALDTRGKRICALERTK